MVTKTGTNVLIVGCGDLGMAVAEQLSNLGLQVTGLKRHVQSDVAVRMIVADVTQPATLEPLRYLQFDMLIYCVAADAQSDEAYQSTYVSGLSHVLATQVNNARLKHVFFVSSTRVYGMSSDVMLDESTPTIPSDYGGERLLEGEHLLSTLACSTTALRLSGIYGPTRTRMIRLAQSLALWPKQNQWSNRIHRDDAASFIVHLVKEKMTGKKLATTYIVTDSTPATQYEVLSWIAHQLNLPSLPAAVPIGGKRLSNRAMLASGFELKYPSYQLGYHELLSQAGNLL